MRYKKKLAKFWRENKKYRPIQKLVVLRESPSQGDLEKVGEITTVDALYCSSTDLNSCQSSIRPMEAHNPWPICQKCYSISFQFL
jgi:hypothetical protein